MTQVREPSPIAILIADRWSALHELVTDALAAYWLPEFTLPRIVAIADSGDDPVAKVTRWLGRYSAQYGRFAPVINPARGESIKESYCVHRIGVTELLLGADPEQVDQFYAMGIWTRLTPRSRRFWMRLSPQLPIDIAENASAANPVLTIQVGGWRTLKLAIISRDLIAAEVTGRALRSVIQPQSASGISPWQEPIVQAGIELHLGARSGSDVSLGSVFSTAPVHPDLSEMQEILRRTSGLMDTELPNDKTPSPVKNGRGLG